jgi:hypothetical protein
MRRHFVQLSLSLCISSVFSSLDAQEVPPVYFNHVTIFLPADAYAALLESQFLRNGFSAFTEQTVTTETRSYTGIYLRGKHTYLELFKASADLRPCGTVMRPVGQIVFNMWIDHVPLLPSFKDRLAKELGSGMQIDTVRAPDHAPRYDYVSRTGDQCASLPGGSVDTVVKGYYPDGRTREKALEGRFLADRLLQDVTAFTVTVNDAERKQLLQEFRAYAYAIRSDGKKRVAVGPEVSFTLVPEMPKIPRSLIVDLSLSRETTSEQSYKFGDVSELRLQGNTARWVFTYPGN